MKKLLGNRWVIAIAVLLLLALIIWFVGPYVAIAGVAPLASVVGRLVALLLLVLGWGAWLQVRALRASRADAKLGEAIASAPAAAGGAKQDTAEEQQLRQRFAEAIKALRAGGRKDLYSLPWYVIIGPPGSGKTTALVNSGLKFPLEQKFGAGALRGVGGTRDCDWWFTDEAVLIDTAGRYTTQDSDARADAGAWGEFLKLLRRHRGRRPINGVLVAISVADLLGDPRTLESHVAAVRRRLDEIGKQLGMRVPVYFLLTKADLIAGFTEFFDDLGQEERRQVWGVTFPVEAAEDGSVATRFPADFDALALRVQQRRIERLVADADPRRRSAILAFPAQLAQLRPRLVAFVEQAFAASRYDAPVFLRGVYLTSGTQESTPIDRAMGALARSFGIEGEAAVRPRAGAGRAYFLERVLREVVFPEAGLAGTNRRAELRNSALQLAGYAACALLLVGGLAAFAVSWNANRAYLAEVAAATRAYGEAPAPVGGIAGERLADALPRLDAAEEVAKVANRHADDVPWSMRFGLYRGAAVGAAATEAYRRELSGSLLPVLRDRLQDGIGRSVAEPEKLYELLRAYLMLGDPKRLQPAEMGAIAGLEWGALFPENPATRTRLAEHSGALFADPGALRALGLDGELVKRSQASLAAASLPELMFRRLKLAYAADAERAIRLDAVAGSAETLVRRSGRPLAEPIPALYSKAAFDEFQTTGRMQLVKQFLDDAWVLGDSAPPATALRDVGDQVLALYEADYVRAWDEVLQDVRVRPARSPEDLQNLLRLLGSPNSPLKVWYGLVARNTNFAQAAKPAGPPAANAALAALNSRAAQLDKMLGGGPAVVPGQRITKHFAPFHAFAAGPIDQILGSFQRAAADLGAAAAGGGNPGATAGQAAALDQLKAEAALLPAAVAAVVAEVAAGTTEVVGGQARTELAQLYQQEVVRACREAIAGRFPFEAGAARDVPLDDFARLFGPGGVYDAFFKQYLQALVDTSRNPWVWREGAGEAAAVPGMLERFQAAERIRDVFFRAGAAGPEVRFNVSVASLDAAATRFVFEVDGRQLEYRHGPARTVPMQWPGAAAGQASVQFEPAGPGTSLVAEGPWALFRLLQKAQVQAQSDTRFAVGFQGGAYSARLQVDAASVRNPFARGDVLRFRCGS